MKNYMILEEDKHVAAWVEEKVVDLDLEMRLSVHHPNVGKSCPLEARYMIKAGDKEDPWFGDVLRIYVDEDNPSIDISDSPWVGYSICRDSNNLGVFQLDATLIRLYSDKALEDDR